jgi:acyl dehydratase
MLDMRMGGEDEDRVQVRYDTCTKYGGTGGVIAMKVYPHLADLTALVGEPLGSSAPVTVDQARIDAFAACTDDAQWIHVDPVRAADGPFGTPIAHGFLTLALLPRLMATAFELADARMGLNYGVNRVRFMAPVPVGSALRAHFRLLAFEPLAEPGAQLVLEAVVEREGQTKPVCVAEMVVRHYT